ncbi:MAG: CDP-alcohol phosphatidyltransferase family protein [Myxococcota bacterium]|nr:CDP-alcohol phosphatidyltransferase family protein [Myxococcota bacterium]
MSTSESPLRWLDTLAGVPVGRKGVAAVCDSLRAMAPGNARRDWLTWANFLTGLRLGAAPACAVSIASADAGLALAFYAVGVVTDLADGPIARRRGEASRLGGLFDHATDAIFVSLGLFALSARGEIPLVLPGLVVLAFVQYAVDSRVQESRPLRASSLGRWNGIAYFVLLGVPLVRDGLGISWPGPGVVRFLAWALVASTLVSMIDRLLAKRR